VKTPSGFWRKLVMGFGLGVALAAPSTAANEDIVVGQIGPWTVIPVPDAQQVNQGLRAGISYANAHGGINGRKLTLFELDDAYSGDGFARRFAEAMQRKPVALLSPIGSAALARLFSDKLLDKNDVVVLNAIPGAESFRTPGHPRLFHVRAGDRQQIEKMVLHARTLGITRMTVLYETITIGQSGMEMAKDAAVRAGGMELRAFSAPREAGPIAEAAKKIAASDTQSVLVLGSPRFNVDGIAELRKGGVSQPIFTLSYVPAPLLAKVVGDAQARGIGLAQTFPNPLGVNSPLQRDFHTAMKDAFPEVPLTSYTSFHIEGYITARVLVDALRKSPQATPDALARTLKTMGEIDLGGFRVNFGKSNVGSAFVDIGVVTSGGRLMY
jgi:branched-chain amino acid transport system substrate-binding protein